MPKDYQKEVLREGGYSVVFSNKGTKQKKNPNPVNYKGEKVKCGQQECQRFTKAAYGGCTEHTRFTYEKDWIGNIVVPNATHENSPVPSHSEITELLINWMKGDDGRIERVDRFIKGLLDDDRLGIAGKIPDSATLQKKCENEEHGDESPDWVVNRIRELIDQNFPKKEFENVKLNWTDKNGELHGLPIRIVATTLTLGFACEESNRGDAWFFSKFGEDIKKYAPNLRPQMASAYMSSIYFFLRRYTKASIAQATKASSGR